MEKRDIYLNSNLIAPCRSAVEAMKNGLERVDFDLNPRLQMIYDLVGAEMEDSFVFTSSGAEAIHQVHWTAFVEYARKKGKCHFITTPFEDATMLKSLKRLEDFGCFVKIVPLTSSGEVDLEQLEKMLSVKTALVSLSLASFLSGVIQPIEQIANRVRAKGVLLHIDVSSSLGKIEKPFQYADYLTFSGVQIHACPGTGALFAKKGVSIIPLICGGAQQNGLRGGEWNGPAFLSLSAAASQAELSMDLMNLEVARLRDRLESIFCAKPLFQDSFRLPNVALLSFPNVHQEALLFMLEKKGVFPSIGGDLSPHLHRYLIGCGVSEEIAETALSFYLSRFTTDADIEMVCKVIEESVLSLQLLSQDLF